MKTYQQNKNSDRRKFLSSLATGAASISLTTMVPAVNAFANTDTGLPAAAGDPVAWFEKIKGTQRIVFDATQPHEIYPFAWPRVFLLTNEMTGQKENDCGVVVVLRHTAIGYAMEDRLWAKYHFGEVFQANDPETGKPALRNPFWKPKAGAFKIPGFGEVLIGINELQANGVMFCVCEAAITVFSTRVAKDMNMDASEVRKDFMSGVLPGIQAVPSGVWALGRAQNKGCGYIFAG